MDSMGRTGSKMATFLFLLLAIVVPTCGQESHYVPDPVCPVPAACPQVALWHFSCHSHQECAADQVCCRPSDGQLQTCCLERSTTAPSSGPSNSGNYTTPFEVDATSATMNPQTTVATPVPPGDGTGQRESNATSAAMIPQTIATTLTPPSNATGQRESDATSAVTNPMTTAATPAPRGNFTGQQEPGNGTSSVTTSTVR